ncbi:MAG: peroxide stress protein YaaA [Bacteroidales bacterium]
MQIILSPAKKLDFDSALSVRKASQPRFLNESQELINELAQKSPSQLQSMMKISGNLAQLNAARFKQWHLPFNLDNARQAVLAFNGDVYEGLKAKEMTAKELEYAQQHLFILSGLHGILRPLDLIQPYRLEMGSKFKTENWNSLYDFWGNKITEVLNETNDPVLINLASQEYFKVIRPENLNARVITPVFKELKGDKLRTLSIYAKKARGMLSRYILQHQIEDPEAIKAFDEDGYRYHESLSDEANWVFTR